MCAVRKRILELSQDSLTCLVSSFRYYTFFMAFNRGNRILNKSSEEEIESKTPLIPLTSLPMKRQA